MVILIGLVFAGSSLSPDLRIGMISTFFRKWKSTQSKGIVEKTCYSGSDNWWAVFQDFGVNFNYVSEECSLRYTAQTFQSESVSLINLDKRMLDFRRRRQDLLSEWKTPQCFLVQCICIILLLSAFPGTVSLLIKRSSRCMHDNIAH